MVKIMPTMEQHDKLLDVMERFNRSCCYINDVAFENTCKNKIELSNIVYHSVRNKFCLSSQLTTRAITESFLIYNNGSRLLLKKHRSIPYDKRTASLKPENNISILTLDGREIIPIQIGAKQMSKLRYPCRPARLIFRNKMFFILLYIDVPIPKEYDPITALGVDLGIVNLAVDSDGFIYSSTDSERINKINNLRFKLRLKNTKSSKRHLRKISRKISNITRNTNHCISKELVAKAKDTNRSIALEDLKGISSRKRLRVQRGNQWSYRRMRDFIEYKSALNGVPVMVVDPRHTSNTCPRCGYVSKSNRPSRDDFICRSCGLAGLSDHVAAINIAARAKNQFAYRFEDYNPREQTSPFS